MKAAHEEMSGRAEVEGDVVPQAVAEQNAIRERREAAAAAYEEANAGSDEGDGDLAPPAKSASAEEWKTWAVESGTMTQEEADATTKTALVDKYGS